MIKKLKTIKNLNWQWAWKYYKKKLSHQFYFLISKIKGRNYWEVDIDGVKVKFKVKLVDV